MRRNLGFCDLMSSVMKICEASIQQSAYAPLAQAAVNGCSRSRIFIQDTAVAGVAMDTLGDILRDPGAGVYIEPPYREDLLGDLKELRAKLDALCQPAMELLKANADHFQKHKGAKRHADRVAYAPRGSQLSKAYQADAARLTGDIMRLTESVQEAIGGSRHDVPWGQFLFDAIVKRSTLPAIGRRENCSVEDAWMHVDTKAHDGYRASCRSFDPSSASDPFGFMCMHLGQAMSIHKSDAAQIGIVPNQQTLDPRLRSERDSTRSVSESSTDEYPVFSEGDRSSYSDAVDSPGSANDTGGTITPERRPFGGHIRQELGVPAAHIPNEGLRNGLDGSPGATGGSGHPASNHNAEAAPVAPLIDAKHGGIVNSTIVGGDVVVSGDTTITINLCPGLFDMDHVAALGKGIASTDEKGESSPEMAYLRAAVQMTLDAIIAVRSQRSRRGEVNDFINSQTRLSHKGTETTHSQNGPGRLFQAGDALTARSFDGGEPSGSPDRVPLTMRTDLASATSRNVLQSGSLAVDPPVESADTQATAREDGPVARADLHRFSDNPTPASIEGLSNEPGKNVQTGTKLLNLLGPSNKEPRRADQTSRSMLTPNGPHRQDATQRLTSLKELAAATKAAVASVERQSGRGGPSTIGETVEPLRSKADVDDKIVVSMRRAQAPLKRLSPALKAAVESVEAQHARLESAKFTTASEAPRSASSMRKNEPPRKPWAAAMAQRTAALPVRKNGDKETHSDPSKYTGKKWGVVVPALNEMYAPLGLTALIQPSNKVDPGRTSAATPAKAEGERSFNAKSAIKGETQKSLTGAVPKSPGTLASAQKPSAAKKIVSTDGMLLATNGGRRFDMRSSHIRAANPTSAMIASWSNGAPKPARETKPAWH